MSSGPYNHWPQSNGFVAPQADLSLYTSSDSQQSHQLHLPYQQTSSTLSSTFVDTHQTQYAGAANPQGESHTQIYTFGSARTSSNLPVNTGSSQTTGSMLDDSFELVQSQLPSPSQPGASGGTFHQSKRPRPLVNQGDPDLNGEVSAEKESGRRQ